MRWIVMAFSFFVFSTSGLAQIGGEDEVYLSSDRIDPTFNGGGIKEFYTYINREFDFSKVTKNGKMITAFTVNELGEIKNIKVIQFLDIESATEIIRVLKKAPKWQPAKRNGKAISVDLKLPLDFNSVNPKKETPSEVISKKEKEETTDTNESKKASNEFEEKRPEFGAGMDAFYKFVSQNFKVPEVENLKGKIIVSFIVDVDGSLTDFKVIKDIGYGTGKEAIRVLKLSPKWEPGTQGGKAVRAIYTLPITIAGSKK